MEGIAPHLLLNDKRYSLDDLRNLQIIKGETEFETEVLQFCSAWLKGEDQFTLTTSGSTGTPATITIQRSAMEASARATAAALGLKAGDVALVCLNARYIAGKMMLVRSLVTGMNIVSVEPASDPFAGLSESLRVDFTALVPYQLAAVLASGESRKKLSKLKSVLVGGAGIDAKTRALLSGIHTGFYATYGMTETVSHVALQKLNPPDQQDHFYAMPGTHISLDDRGCLVIQPDYLGIGKITTNDLGEVIRPGEFRWLGRWDNIINTGGVKVIPEKIENAVAEFFEQHSLTCRYFAAGVPGEMLGEIVVLVVEGTLSDGKESDLLKFLASKLSRYEMPKKILYTGEFKETETKKINRIATTAELISNY